MPVEEKTINGVLAEVLSARQGVHVIAERTTRRTGGKRCDAMSRSGESMKTGTTRPWNARSARKPFGRLHNNQKRKTGAIEREKHQDGQ